MFIGNMCSIDSNCIFNNPYKNNVDMKSNEAPEKIYSIPTEGGFYLTAIKPEPPFVDGIEYTRTDAFIEKACDWLNDLVLSDYVDIKETSDGTFVTFDQDKLVKDFKNTINQ